LGHHRNAPNVDFGGGQRNEGRLGSGPEGGTRAIGGAAEAAVWEFLMGFSQQRWWI